MKKRLELNVNNLLPDLRIITQDGEEQQPLIKYQGKSKKRNKITCFLSAAAVVIACTFGTYFAGHYFNQSRQNLAPSIVNTPHINRLEEELGKHQIFSKTTVQVADMEELFDKCYKMRTNKNIVIYHFDLEQKKIEIYNLREK